MQDEIMVSVSCLTYNHEPYIRDCLEGFVNQKTNFKFEVLIHDDASTDKTADIIREYEAKYPDIIKPIYQTENQFQKGIRINRVYQYPRAKGKYLAWCEGDDYWCDENKLQKQYDAMESNTDCVICFHTTKSISENGKDLNRNIPKKGINEGKYDSRNWLQMYFEDSKLCQLSSFFVKANVTMGLEATLPTFMTVSPVGDKPLVLLYASKGNIYFINKIMSAYRICSKGSWNERVKSFSEEKKRDIFNRSIQTLEEYDKYTEYQYTDLVQLAIKRYYFNQVIENKEYKQLFSKEYKEIFQSLPAKQKLYNRIFGCFPGLEKIYQRGRKGN